MKPERGARVVLVSLHTSPLDRPGAGDSGGMNVFVLRVATALASRGVAVDVFTRCAGRATPDVVDLAPGARVIEIHAGPCSPLPKEALPGHVTDFTSELLRRVDDEGLTYDLVQTHYWLSGLVGRTLAPRTGAPLVALFHTLARVKNLSVREGEEPEPEARAAAEELVARAASRIAVPTETEARYLAELYGIPADRIRLAPPGVDTMRFRPRDRREARARLGLDPGRPVALVAGRLQPLKGPDLAIRALAGAVARGADLDLVIVGSPGPSGGPANPEHLRRVAGSLGVAHRVRFVRALPHEDMPYVYSAADVVLMPSRSESFGLVALEAQACGVPVVASAVGGLRHVVVDGEGGFLVPPGDADTFADRIVSIVGDAGLARRLAAGARDRARRFSWDETVSRLLALYREIRPDVFAGTPQPA